MTATLRNRLAQTLHARLSSAELFWRSPPSNDDGTAAPVPRNRGRRIILQLIAAQRTMGAIAVRARPRGGRRIRTFLYNSGGSNANSMRHNAIDSQKT